MAHNLQSMLQNEMPEFDVAAAPCAETETPVNPRDALADSVPLSPGAPPEVSIFAPGGTEAVGAGKSSPITVGALRWHDTTRGIRLTPALSRCCLLVDSACDLSANQKRINFL